MPWKDQKYRNGLIKPRKAALFQSMEETEEKILRFPHARSRRNKASKAVGGK
jgi:hypothetical protein